MTERDDPNAKADDVERQLDDMSEQSARLEDEIEDTGEDWERKKRDPAVPGAGGDDDGEPDGNGAGEEGGAEPDGNGAGEEGGAEPDGNGAGEEGDEPGPAGESERS